MPFSRRRGNPMAERPPLSYDFLPPAPELTVKSDDIADGKSQRRCLADIRGMPGENEPPHFLGGGAPAATRSFAVTCHDPDAPRGGGFWHWVVFDIPADVTELPRG